MNAQMKKNELTEMQKKIFLNFSQGSFDQLKDAFSNLNEDENFVTGNFDSFWLNNIELKYPRPWHISFTFDKEDGNLYFEVSHFMTDCTSYGFDKVGNGIFIKAVQKYYSSYCKNCLENKDE